MVSMSLDCNPLFSSPRTLPVQEHHPIQGLCRDVSKIHWSTEEVQTDNGELPAVLGREWHNGSHEHACSVGLGWNTLEVRNICVCICA